MLARIYGEHGQRLLERNVRAFLQAKGKINKGLQKTLKEEPHRFLAYNNGLCCTAASVEVESKKDGHVRLKSVSDFQIVNADEVLVAFQNPVTLSGIAFDDSDLARLTRSASGWSVSMAFDGSDVGLTTSAEAIDAVTGLADGSLLLSTRGSGSVPLGSGSLSFAAEDLLRFAPTSLGTNTAGSWSLWADLSDVGLNSSNENITALDVAADGRVFLATLGSASATAGGTSVSAANEDIFVFRPTSLGATTSGSFATPLFFDGSLYGLASNAVLGLDVPV